MMQTYEKHCKRVENIKFHVYELVELWECEFDKLLKSDALLKKTFDDEKDIKPPLNPRLALSSGRTNAIVLYYEGTAGYIDFTSLYPYVQKYGQFPIGHPKIITENFEQVDKYFGLYTVNYYFHFVQNLPLKI